jgi:hypothetical protein
MEVRIDDVKEVFKKLIDGLEAKGIESVDIPHDFYWSIPQTSRYRPYEEPKDLTMGQLSDDLGELRRIATNEMPATAYALVWLGALLQAIGEQTVE